MLEKRCKIKEKVVSSALNFAHYQDTIGGKK